MPMCLLLPVLVSAMLLVAPAVLCVLAGGLWAVVGAAALAVWGLLGAWVLEEARRCLVQGSPDDYV